MTDTDNKAYTDRLVRLATKGWKSRLDVQAPYRWNLRRQDLGRTLDVGCGIGRNLSTLPAGSLGIDHNPTSVAEAKKLGLAALTVEEWNAARDTYALFDSLLLAHVLEHMTQDEARELIADHLPYVRPGGKVFIICPQERGYRSDDTHVQFLTGEDLVTLVTSLGLELTPWRSFPLPRIAGQWFTYNEFTLLARTPSAAQRGR